MPPQQGQYDFIMNPAKPPRRSFIPGMSPFVARIVMIVGGAIALIILLVIVTSLFGGGGNTPKLTAVAQQQNELIRVATLATSEGTTQASQTTKNFSETALLSLTTSQQQLLNFLASHGKKLSSKQLGLTKNPATDQALTAALASSSFDATYVSIMQTQLKSYQSLLQSAFDGTKNTAERQLLSDQYASSQLLVQQLNGAATIQ